MAKKPTRAKPKSRRKKVAKLPILQKPVSKDLTVRPINRLRAKIARMKVFRPLHIYLATSLLLVALGWTFLADLPSPKNLSRDLFPISTKIFDRNGQLLYEIYAEENRTPVKISELPPHVLQATVAIEDKNFYTHHGFDTGGIIRAAYKTLSGQRLEGGSTITQQLVKVALLTPERTVIRKIKEATLALATEILYDKNQILEMYLNHIPYGGTSYGIEAASQSYFNKSARDLSLAESALLVGLPQAPSRFSPFANPDNAKLRQSQVLDRMVEEKYITSEQALAAKKEELDFALSKIDIKAPHFVMYVRAILEEKYGIHELESGGLRVTTSLDLELQELATASLSAEIAKLEKLKVSNGAALVTNPSTGEILAMVGSRDYFDTKIDGKVNVTTRLRQPGSSIKPLNYALGIETKAITPSTMLLDAPICFQVEGQADYCPKNYDNSFRGPAQIRFALGNSLNIPAVKTLAINGVENFIHFARKMGINSWTDPSRYGLSLTLGGGEVTMLDLATAFGVFANSGTKVPLVSILKVEDHNGKILESLDPEARSEKIESTRDSLPAPDNTDKVISPATSFLISHILSDNNARSLAFGSNSVLNVPGKTVSVKTGTTNSLRDNWTIGYTQNRLVAVWVGNNDNTPMSYVASGVTGASPIWQDIMKVTLKDIETPGPHKPKDGIEGASVCADTGVLPSADNTCPTRYEYFLKDTIPTNPGAVRKEIWINRDTRHPPVKKEEFDNIELQEHLVTSDSFTLDYCLDCDPYPEGITEPPTFFPYEIR